jgi:hypothetical protein
MVDFHLAERGARDDSPHASPTSATFSRRLSVDKWMVLISALDESITPHPSLPAIYSRFRDTGNLQETEKAFRASCRD